MTSLFKTRFLSIGCSLWSLRTTMGTLPLCINHYQFYLWFAHITRICRSPPRDQLPTIPRFLGTMPVHPVNISTNEFTFVFMDAAGIISSVGFGIKKSLEIFWWCRLECEDVNAALIYHCCRFEKKHCLKPKAEVGVIRNAKQGFQWLQEWFVRWS